MKANIENNSFDLTQIKLKIQNKFIEQIKDMKEMIKLFKQKEEKKK